MCAFDVQANTCSGGIVSGLLFDVTGCNTASSDNYGAYSGAAGHCYLIPGASSGWIMTTCADGVTGTVSAAQAPATAGFSMIVAAVAAGVAVKRML